jgi:hypothetical protein
LFRKLDKKYDDFNPIVVVAFVVGNRVLTYNRLLLLLFDNDTNNDEDDDDEKPFRAIGFIPPELPVRLVEVVILLLVAVIVEKFRFWNDNIVGWLWYIVELLLL